jgi:hypothetical protein
MPTSDKQIAANRANAAKSTAPRIPEGKARSCLARKEFDRLKALRPEFPKEAISEAQPEENKPPSTPPSEPVSNPQSNPEPSKEVGKRGADDPVVCALTAHPARSSHRKPVAQKRCFRIRQNAGNPCAHCPRLILTPMS